MFPKSVDEIQDCWWILTLKKGLLFKSRRLVSVRASHGALSGRTLWVITHDNSKFLYCSWGFWGFGASTGIFEGSAFRANSQYAIKYCTNGNVICSVVVMGKSSSRTKGKTNNLVPLVHVKGCSPVRMKAMYDRQMGSKRVGELIRQEQMTYGNSEPVTSSVVSQSGGYHRHYAAVATD
jgi:hypothetical protein